MNENWLQQLFDQVGDQDAWPQAVESLRNIPWKDKITKADLAELKNEGEQLVPLLLWALEDKRGDIQGRAAMTLMRVGDVAFPTIQTILNSSTESALKEPGRILLGSMGYFWDQENARTHELIEIAVQKFLTSLSHSGSGESDALSTQAVAAAALMAHGVNEDSAVERLGLLLDSNDPKVQLQVAGMLAGGGVEVERAIDLGIAGLNAADSKLRVLAARVLGRIGEPASRAVPALLDHLDEQDGYASSAIKKSLVAIGPVGIPEIVQVMNGNPNPQVRARCAAVLSGKAAAAAFDDLHRLAIHDPDDDVRWRASRALRQINGRRENPAYLESILVNSNHRENGS